MINSEIDKWVKSLQHTLIDTDSIQLDRDTNNSTILAGLDGSNIKDKINFDHIKTKNDTVNFLRYIVPKMGRAKTVTTAFDKSKPE